MDNNGKYVLVPVELLKSILPNLNNVDQKQKLETLLSSRQTIETHEVTKLPKKAKVKRVVDGDTIELENGLILRYVGMTAPETGEDCYQESTNYNKTLVEEKEITLEYDNYKSDKFGRILAYAILPDNKNVSIEMVKKGMAELVIYQKRKPFIHQPELLKVQEEAKQKNIGIWKNK